ncbi:MAG TPA: GntR family transcriptional regulator [Casimicrobiaceae bacterium]|jgi:GntR family transcriptional regulator
MSARQAVEESRRVADIGGGGEGLALPRFKAVKAAITAALVAGEWKPGASIPAEARLAERYAVSIGTLRKAIDELVAEQILVRRQGLGTFVAVHGPTRNRFHFFHIVDAEGRRELPQPRFLGFARARADAQEAAALHIDTGARTIRISNLLLLSGEPAVFDTIVIAAAMFPDLTEARFRARDSTIYHFYQTHYGINVVRTHERLRAGTADRRAAKALGIDAGAPVLEILRTAFTYHDLPVELRHSVVDTRARFYEADRGKAEAGRPG